MKLQKSFGSLLALFFLFILISPISSEADTQSIPDPQSEFKADVIEGFGGVDTVDVPIHFVSDSSITFFQNLITWDSTKIVYVGAYRGSAWPESVGTFDTSSTQGSFTVSAAYSYDPDGVVFSPNDTVFCLRFFLTCFGFNTTTPVSFSDQGDANAFVCGGRLYHPDLTDGGVKIPQYDVAVWGEFDTATIAEKDIKATFFMWNEFPVEGCTTYITYDPTKFELKTTIPPPGDSIYYNLLGDTIQVISSIHFDPSYDCTLFTLVFDDTVYEDNISSYLSMVYPSRFVSACGEHYPWISLPGSIIVPDYKATAKVDSLTGDDRPCNSAEYFYVPFYLSTSFRYPIHKYVFRLRFSPFNHDSIRFDDLVGVGGFPDPDFSALNSDTSEIEIDIPLQDLESGFSVPSWDTEIFKLKFQRVVPGSVHPFTKIDIDFITTLNDFNYVQSMIDSVRYIKICLNEVPGTPVDSGLTLIPGLLQVRFCEPGCPYIYVWDGDELKQDNTILTFSETKARGEDDITDYYFLGKSPYPDKEEYRLQISEFEKEKSDLDFFELITVDHPEDINVGVSPEGDIFGYKEQIAILSCVDDKGEDQLKKIESKDGLLYTKDGSGYLILDFGIMKYRRPEYYVLTEDAVSKFDDVTLTSVEVETDQGWYEVTEFPPRANSALSFALIDAELFPSEDKMRIKVSWDNGKCEIDALKYFMVDNEAQLDIYQNSLTSATHSQDGDVFQKLSQKDKIYAVLEPGQDIDLTFRYPIQKPESERDFALKSCGYYERLRGQEILSQHSDTPVLFDNYPNPFNPNTKITYVLPADSKVNLSVYNVLGQKVKTLLDEHQTAGEWSVIWDGKDSRGKRVSSGVYFYKLKADKFTQTKKMLLTK